jgi:hypothetical protein
MPVIGPDLSRRTLLAASAAALARAADPAQETWDVITAMAAALSRSSDGEFMAACDPSLPGYEDLRTNVHALVAAVDMESGIDPVSNTGDDRARDVEADWTLQLVDRSGFGRVTRRRQNVKFRFEIRGRKWKVVKLEPASFFAPPSA